MRANTSFVSKAVFTLLTVLMLCGCTLTRVPDARMQAMGERHRALILEMEAAE